MNKTAIIIGFFTLAGLGVIGAVLILTLRPESIGTLTSTLVTVLGLATTAAVTFAALDKQDKKLETIKTQTNGANTALREENASLTAQLLAVVGTAPTADQSVGQSVPEGSAGDRVGTGAHVAPVAPE